MKVYVVYRDYVYEGYGHPLKAFYSLEDAESYIEENSDKNKLFDLMVLEVE